jgi:hypothetical protein
LIGKGVQYIRKNFDPIAILTAVAAIAATDEASDLSEEELSVLAALKRSNSALQDASLPDIQDYLSALDNDQIKGLVSNVKGILHETEFVRIENEDGDSVFASIFPSTNHPDTDIQLLDQSSGETWEIQLKATDNEAYVNDWIETHPDGEIVVTEELAEKMGLPSSGQSNEEITVRVDDFVDKMREMSDSDSLWDYFPALSAASIALVFWELWRRYKNNEINWETFKTLAARATGLKVAKIGLIIFLLTIPIVGQITGAALVAQILISAKKSWFNDMPADKFN